MEWLIIIILAILTAFNGYYLIYFIRKASSEGKISEKDNYYKLDAKIEFLKYLTIGLISIAAFFGFQKYTDLSDKFDQFEELNTNYYQLKETYNEIRNENVRLKNQLNEINESIINFQIEKKDIEIEYIKLNHRITEAARKIPEANIRILTKKLIETNLRDAGTSQLWISDPDTIAIKRELNNSIDMLRSAGYSSDEIDKIIKDIKLKYNWIK